LVTEPMTTTEATPPPVPTLPQAKNERFKFVFVYGVLGLIAAGSLGAFVIATTGLTSPAKWSSWKPSSGPTLVMAKEIADNVAPKYRLASGSQLLAVIPSAPAVTSGTHTVGIVAVATRSRVGGKQTVSQLTTGHSVMYTLCGLGARCAIATGKPSVARGELVRREGLELALYTFKYIPSVDSVLIYVPPAQAPGAPMAPILYFTRDSLSGRLATPLQQTLPLATPPRAGQTDPAEIGVLDALTLPHLYASGLVQLQVGGALLALVHEA
jgi:hypothetical protein